MMRRAATRRTYNTSERVLARRAERVSKDIATSVADSDTRSGIATRARVKGKVSARTVGMAKAQQRWIRRHGVQQGKGRRWQGRHAEGLFWVWVYGACHQELPEEHECPASGGGRPRDSLHRQRSEQRSTGDFVKDTPRVPLQKTHIGRTGVAKNRFKVLEVDEEEEEVVNVRQVENNERTDSVVCDFDDGKAKNRVQFVIREEDWASLGVGDRRIVLASGAGRRFPDEGKPEEDVAKDCEWRRHAALRRERGDFQV